MYMICICADRSFFEDLLDKDKSVLIHVKNLTKFIIKIFKVAKNLSALIISEVFEEEVEKWKPENCPCRLYAI